MPLSTFSFFSLCSAKCKIKRKSWQRRRKLGTTEKRAKKERDAKKQNETRMCKWDLVSFRHAQLVGTFVHPDRRALHVRLYRVHHLSLCCHDWLFSGVLDSTWSWTMAARSLKIWLTSPMSDSSWATLRSRSCKYSRFCSSSSISCFRIMGQDSIFKNLPLLWNITWVLFCPPSMSIRFWPPPSPGGTWRVAISQLLQYFSQLYLFQTVGAINADHQRRRKERMCLTRWKRGCVSPPDFYISWLRPSPSVLQNVEPSGSCPALWWSRPAVALFVVSTAWAPQSSSFSSVADNCSAVPPATAPPHQHNHNYKRHYLGSRACSGG